MSKSTELMPGSKYKASNHTKAMAEQWGGREMKKAKISFEVEDDLEVVVE